jgi:ADP-ribose pyrophosphatase YjhB (NUDIX family)
MDDIRNNPRFAEHYARLASVRLNPRRHTAADGLDHSEAVAARAAALARANGCSPAETAMLENLGRAHDIGKVTGSAQPTRSLDVLRDCGVDDPGFLALVQWHDTNLPWYQSHQRGQAPSDKAWRKLSSQVPLRLLCLFMVADRVDAPPGWRRNAPLAWFLAEARARDLIPELTLDLPDHPGEISAGGVVVRDGDRGRELLLIRARAGGYELPKGHIEWDELPEEAAAREVREEAGVESELEVGPELGRLEYMVGAGAERRLKRVRYFAMTGAAPLRLGPLPSSTGERRWASLDEVRDIALVSEALRPLLVSALGADQGSAGSSM